MTTENTATETPKMTNQERRQALRELSKIAKMRIAADCEGMTVNEVLVKEMYNDNENTEFKTLHEWNRDGYQIKKGATAFLVWGKPKAKQQEQEKQQNPDEEEETDFYPLCYLFSNAQVQKREQK